RRSLHISPTPFKSSFLAIPPSPFSPRIPLTPPPLAQKHTRYLSSEVRVPPSSEAPSSPLAWVWTCHQCHRSYHLGVTRRCLDDGHHFCAGTTTVKQWRKPVGVRRHKRHRACTSEFDYQGWKTWSRWRGSGQKRSVNKQDCWNMCSYPSECRWGKKFGIHTPVATEFPTVEFDATPALPAPVELEGVLKPENCKEIIACKEKSGFWETLSATARRRANVIASSPLAILAPDAEPTMDQNGDVVMTTVDSD
ncbi:hypothetical protein P153DRAFT_250341, partial [Dothidotthia symphoricarpi CBS 119687]